MIAYRSRKGTRYIIIHDSHTPPDIGNGQTYLRHRGREMGLLDIGYHFIIERDGQVALCRPAHTKGSHTPGFNHESVGVCLLGGEDKHGNAVDNFTNAQRESLRVTCRWLLEAYPEARVVGHTELQKSRKRKKPCPALDMKALRASL